jgi:hypothetical protein
MAKFATKEIRSDENGIATGVRFAFKDGTILDCELEAVSLSQASRLAAHGLSQKIGDSYASLGKVEECVEAAGDMWARLKAGDWTGTRAAGGMTVQAIANVLGKDIEDVKETWATLSGKEKAGITKDPRVGAEVARLRAAALEKKESSLDLDTIF